MTTSLHISSNSSASKSLRELCLRVTQPPFLQVRQWLTECGSPQAQTLAASLIEQLYLKHTESWNCCLFRTKPYLRAKRLSLCLSRGYQSSLRWMLALCRPSLRLLQEVAVEAKPSHKETHNTTVVFTFIALLVTLRLYRISICYDLIVL